MPSAPSRITEDIDIRRPEGQPLVNIAVTVLYGSVVFCARFLCNDIPCLFHQLRVPCCGKPDGLREHRTQSLSEKNANARRKATLARRADAVQQLYRVLDKMESRNPEWQQDILFMREQISRLNGESAT